MERDQRGNTGRAGTRSRPAPWKTHAVAIKWVARNAKEYNVDPDRIVITGQSAGGHLALIAGMVPESAGLDNRCNAGDAKGGGHRELVRRVDYTTLIDDPTRDYARTWVGPNPNRMEVPG